MTPRPVPPEAVADELVRAAVQAIRALRFRFGSSRGLGPIEPEDEDIARTLIPLIAAAERKRIRKLAEQHGAVYDETEACSCGRTVNGKPCRSVTRSRVPFADLIREDTPS